MYMYILHIHIKGERERKCKYYSSMPKATSALNISFSSTRHATDFYAYSVRRCAVKCAKSRKDRLFPQMFAE